MKAEPKVTAEAKPPEKSLSQQIGMEIWKQGTANSESNVSRADVIKMLPPGTEVGSNAFGGAVLNLHDIPRLLEYEGPISRKLNSVRVSALWDQLRMLRNDIAAATVTKTTKVQRDMAVAMFGRDRI